MSTDSVPHSVRDSVQPPRPNDSINQLVTHALAERAASGRMIDTNETGVVAWARRAASQGVPHDRITYAIITARHLTPGWLTPQTDPAVAPQQQRRPIDTAAIVAELLRR